MDHDSNWSIGFLIVGVHWDYKFRLGQPRDVLSFVSSCSVGHALATSERDEARRILTFRTCTYISIS